MMNLRKWIRGDREPVVQQPVIVQEVAPAEQTDKLAEARVHETQVNYIQTMLRLSRRSAALRNALANAALDDLGGGHRAKNHH